ncbi:type II toxin-antitoxin system RelE/ParE family toxin [Paludisphaera rhizosphaerae]|uniref:type II toxin-antitoxin system RelE/ParE family toxin n=1 Tax=Paludisphaera rhizosphaerae TaxID=2711216 RepID=UPI00389948A0
MGAESVSDALVSREALVDLDEVCEYLSQLNATAADRLLGRFFAAARLYARFPRMGQALDDLSSGLRCFTAHPHVAFYRLERGPSSCSASCTAVETSNG